MCDGNGVKYRVFGFYNYIIFVEANVIMVIYYERNKVIFLESDYHIFGMVIKNEKLVFLNGAHGSLLFMKQKKIGWYGKQFLGKILISKKCNGSNGNSWIQNGMSILIDFWNPYHNHFFSLGCF